VSYSNIDPKTSRFSDIRANQPFDFKKYRDLEIRVRGHLRSLQVVPFDRLYMVSYYYPIHGSRMTIRCTVFEIFGFKNDGTLKTGLRISEGH